MHALAGFPFGRLQIWRPGFTANYDSPAGCLIYCSSQPSTSGGCLANAPTDAHTLTNTHS